MTVSNVANGRKLVHPETEKKVRKVIQKLGYRPQSQARGLRLSRSWAIGMQIVMKKRDFLALPWMGRAVAGLSNTLNAHGYGLLLHSQSAEELSESVLLKHANTDGLIAMLSGPEGERKSILQKLNRLRQPIIALQETLIPGPNADFAIIRQDDRKGAAMLAEHLLAQGCRRIVFLTPDFSWPNMEERTRGLELTIGKQRDATLRSVMCNDDSYAAVESAVISELREHGLPDAFVAGNESIALAVLEVIERNGYRIPEDVKLTGFNAFDLWFFARKRITTIDFPAYEIGVRAGEAMLERLRMGRFQRKLDVFPGRFIQGVTTAASQGRDAPVSERPVPQVAAE
jgi:DNA-binding LacI/PurR family transcriptional regulator